METNPETEPVKNGHKSDVSNDEWTYNKHNWLDPDFHFIHKVKFSRKQLKLIYCFVSVIGIILVPFLLVFYLLQKIKYKNKSCYVTETHLIYKEKQRLLITCGKKYNKIEISIPIRDITDLSMKQSWIQRLYNVWDLHIFTTSFSSDSEVVLRGIVDPKEIKRLVHSLSPPIVLLPKDDRPHFLEIPASNRKTDDNPLSILNQTLLNGIGSSLQRVEETLAKDEPFSSITIKTRIVTTKNSPKLLSPNASIEELE